MFWKKLQLPPSDLLPRIIYGLVYKGTVSKDVAYDLSVLQAGQT